MTGACGTYTVKMDYMKHRVEDVYDGSNTLIGSARVGMGLRITTVVKTKISESDTTLTPHVMAAARSAV